MKKILGLVVMLCIITAFAVCVHAESSGTCGDNLTWTLDSNGTLTISGKGEMDDYEYKNIQRTYWSTAPWGRETVKNIVINEGVTKIGKYAFAYLSLAESVTIPNTVKNIETSSFASCIKLKNVQIENGLEKIGDYAFLSCYELEEIKIPNSVQSFGTKSFGSCKTLKKINIPSGITEIPESMFSICTELSEIDLPDTVTKIGYQAFSSSGVKSVHMSQNIQTIQDWAFYACNNLLDIDLPNGLKDVGSMAFGNCTSLQTLIIPDSMNCIRNAAFNGCYNLKTVNIPDSITNIESIAFGDCSNIRDVFYDNTKEKWESVKIDSGNEPLLNATIHFKTDTYFTVSQTASKAEITNTDSNTQTATVIIAKYENRALKSVSSENVTFAAGEKKTYNLSGDYKVFVWDSLSGMLPLNK